MSLHVSLVLLWLWPRWEVGTLLFFVFVSTVSSVVSPCISSFTLSLCTFLHMSYTFSIFFMRLVSLRAVAVFYARHNISFVLDAYAGAIWCGSVTDHSQSSNLCLAHCFDSQSGKESPINQAADLVKTMQRMAAPLLSL